MKRLLALALCICACLTIFWGCSESEQDPIAVYSFHGQSEAFSVVNGIIGICLTDDVFYGGILTYHLDTPAPSDIAAYTVKFYQMFNDTQNVIFTESFVNESNNDLQISGELGKMIGDTVFSTDAADPLTDPLYVSLSVTDRNENTVTYRLQLTVTKVS